MHFIRVGLTYQFEFVAKIAFRTIIPSIHVNALQLSLQNPKPLQCIEPHLFKAIIVIPQHSIESCNGT